MAQEQKKEDEEGMRINADCERVQRSCLCYAIDRMRLNATTLCIKIRKSALTRKTRDVSQALHQRRPQRRSRRVKTHTHGQECRPLQKHDGGLTARARARVRFSFSRTSVCASVARFARSCEIAAPPSAVLLESRRRASGPPIELRVLCRTID